MGNEKPVNKPLVIISFIVIIFGGAWNVASGPIKYGEPTAAILAGIVLLISPLLVLWFRALWNEIVPRVTSWRRISFIEAAGLLIIPAFFMR